jgi:hypothetical protein
VHKKRYFPYTIVILGTICIILATFIISNKRDFNIVNKFKTSRNNAIPQELSNLNYTIADVVSTGSKAIFRADLDGDGNNEEIVVYWENRQEKSHPIITKVYKYTQNSEAMEVFSFSGEEIKDQIRSGNELYDAKVLPNFWENGKDTFMVINKSTGYGSGYTTYMNFITFGEGKYKVVFGPVLDELTIYKFLGEDHLGTKIAVFKSVWEEGESHFDFHRYSLEKYTYQNGRYIKVSLGITKNKHDFFNSTFDGILDKEPALKEKL